MKELSMHILDITQNSVRANASEIFIEVNENPSDNLFEIIIRDNGPGIPDEILKTIKDPFTTSRTMRKVGLGIPLLNETCEQSGGSLKIESTIGQGTLVHAHMEWRHIDRPPLGDIITTIVGLITSNEEKNIHYKHVFNDKVFEFETKEIQEVLGNEVALTNMGVYLWMKEFMKENINEIYEKI